MPQPPPQQPQGYYGYAFPQPPVQTAAGAAVPVEEAWLPPVRLTERERVREREVVVVVVVVRERLHDVLCVCVCVCV
jgi:hypothetical protein